MLCRQVDARDSTSISASRLAEIGSGLIASLPAFYTAFNVFRNTGKVYLPAMIIVMTGISHFLIVIMRARGKKNAELVSKVRSLRSFIYHPTPKELLANYLEDPEYYYDMLVYALAFGAEESWAITFLTLDVKAPEWYSDDIEGHAFSNLREEPTTIDYARDLRSFTRTIENAYHETYGRR
jgi:hypothetical protein